MEISVASIFTVILITTFTSNPVQRTRMHYYYIDSASKQTGPVDINELKKAGITRKTLVWKEGLKDWVKAGSLAELSVLFEETTATAPGSTAPGAPVPPPPPPSNEVQPAAIANNPLKKLLIPAGAAIILVVIAAFVFFRSDGPDTTDEKITLADSSMLADDQDEPVEEETPKSDTVKIIHPDSLENKLHWDTVTAPTPSPNSEAPAFLPGFGGETSSSKKTKKTSEKRSTKPTGPNLPGGGRTETTERTEPERINPLRYLSISGSFRKNLLFEAVLEGTIQNKYSSQMRDIIVEVRFLDASGQSISTKRFIQPGPLAANSSIPFKFKATAPKGTKNASFSITGASLK